MTGDLTEIHDPVWVETLVRRTYLPEPTPLDVCEGCEEPTDTPPVCRGCADLEAAVAWAGERP